MEAGVGEPARPVEEGSSHEAISLVDDGPGVATADGAGVRLQVPPAVLDREPQGLADSGGHVGVAESPQDRDRLGGRDREVEPGLGRVGGQQRFARVWVPELEEGSEMITFDHALEPQFADKAAHPSPGSFSRADVIVLGAVDDLALVVVGAAKLAYGDHGRPHRWCIGVGHDGQYRGCDVGVLNRLSVGGVVGAEQVEEIAQRDELSPTERDVRETFAASGLSVDARLEVGGRPSDPEEGRCLLDRQERGKILRNSRHGARLRLLSRVWYVDAHPRAWYAHLSTAAGKVVNSVY